MEVDKQFIFCIIVHKPEEGYKWSHKFQNIHPYLKTLEVLGSWEEAYNYVEAGHQVDLIVGSYELTDMHSFIFDKLNKSIPVIFTSLKPFITEKALALNCLDFINENADQDRIQKSFAKYQLLYGNRVEKTATASASLGNAGSETPTSSQKSRFLVKSGESFSYKLPSEVAFFLADGGQTYLIELGTGNKFVTSHKLMELEEDFLDQREFFRINRSVLLNIHAIGRINKYLNSRLKISPKVDYPEELIVSREKVTKFKKWVNQ